MAAKAKKSDASKVDTGDDETKRFVERVEKAKARRDRMNSVIDECYEFGIPLRDRPYASQGSGPELDRLFDSTAPGAVQDLASEMLDDVWPVDAPPFELRAGRDVPERDREELNRNLADVAADLIETINNSDFRDVAHEALLDWEVGSGFMLPEQGDYLDPVRFRHLPLPEAITDTGPFDNVDRLYRPRKPKACDIPIIWPNATIGPDLQRMINSNPDKEVDVTEGFERDWQSKGKEKWDWRVVVKCDKSETIQKSSIEGAGCKPFVDFHYIRVHNEPIGRGPLQLALPDIKTLNLVKQFILEAADIAIGGMWQWDDDGVMNPENITIEPRTIISKMPGSKGLERIDTSLNLNFADIVVGDLQNSIKQILLGGDLGPPEGTPMSATEVLERRAIRARRRAGPYTRLMKGLLFQTVRRVAYIRVQQGAIKLPAIDGKSIVLRPLAPLTRAQAQDEIARHDRYLEMLNVRLGPQLANLTVDGLAYADWLGEKMGVNPKVIRTSLQRGELAKVIATMAANANQQQAA